MVYLDITTPSTLSINITGIPARTIVIVGLLVSLFILEIIGDGSIHKWQYVRLCLKGVVPVLLIIFIIMMIKISFP